MGKGINALHAFTDSLSNRTQGVCVRKPSVQPHPTSVPSPLKPTHHHLYHHHHHLMQIKNRVTQTNTNLTSTHCMSTTRSISTGTPQSTVISPLILTLYTIDFRRKNDKQEVITFSDDTAVVDLTETHQFFL